jgi:DNA topoisomerase VI subunit B
MPAKPLLNEGNHVMTPDASQSQRQPPKAPQLQRIAFQTSRELDFLSEKELVAQTGHQRREWPLVVLKELVDNALDACEEAGVAPCIDVSVDDQGIRVADNGPGIPPEVVASVLDFTIRVSSREAYVAPDRGRQGNALKTVVAMPFVLSGEAGRIRIDARGVRHQITLRVDRIRQQPVIDHQQIAIASTAGTKICVAWPDSPRSMEGGEAHRFLQNAESDDDSPWSEDDDEDDGFLQNDRSVANSPRSILLAAKSRFLQIAADYVWINPHLTLRLDWLGERTDFLASNPNWSKWKPSDPTDPHWYRPEDLERLIAANIAHDADWGRNRTLREFVAEFRGLSSTAKVKQVLDRVDLSRAKLSDLAGDMGIDEGRVTTLLAAMKEATRPVKPAALGLIGKEHLAACCAAAGAEMASFQYKRVLSGNRELPWIVESAFAWRPEASGRRIITGVNWSPGILNPFRQLGGFQKSLDSILEEQRVGRDEPAIVFLHVACPRVTYADRGKSSVIVED